MTSGARVGAVFESGAGDSLRVGAKGQVFIPKGLRDRFNIEPGDEISFSDSGGCLELHRVRNPETLKRRFRGLDLTSALTVER